MSTTVDHLRRIPIFSKCSDTALEQVAGLATEFEVPGGAVLIERGQAGTGLFIIEKGSAVVDLPDGNHIDLGEGEFFGELAVIADTPRTARVSASTDMQGLAIRRNDLMNLMENNGTLAVAVLREVAQRMAARVTPET